MCYEEIRSKEVKTKKPHQCCWCGERINTGEAARARTYLLEGDLQSDHMHLECDAASIVVIKHEKTCINWQPGDYPRGGTEPN